MPGTYSQLLLHVVFSTKGRVPCITADVAERLYPYIGGIVRAEKGVLYDIGGVEDHVHILLSIHQDIRLKDLIRDLKASSSKWIRSSGKYPEFEWWQAGLGIFTVSWNDTERLIDYIKNQEEHHKKECFLDEYKRLIQEAGLEYLEEFED